MEEESSEPTEGGGEEEEYERYEGEGAKKARGPLVKIVAILLAVLVAGLVVWWFVFSNSPPRADFSFSSVDFRLTVNARNSTDPDGNIAGYTWDWGDGSAGGSGVSAAHTYTKVDNYTVTLTVTDTRGAAAADSKLVRLHVAATADFVARTRQMQVSFDASSSSSPTGALITSYRWDFGDGTPPATGEFATHTYLTAGRYTATLNVTDQGGLTGQTTRLVSPASTTVDVLVDQFFAAGCPYAQFWYLRYDTYGDYVLRNQVPCTDYYPWVLYSASVADQAVNPSWVYTLFRWNAIVRNHPGYSVQDPVFLPVFNASVAPDPNSYIQTNLTFHYLGTPEITALNPTPYRVNTKYSDGFGYLLQGTIKMDLTESRRIFGVNATDAASARAWWAANTAFARAAGPLEQQYASWLASNGNGKYDVYNAFEWFYETDITDLNATVASDGTTTVSVFFDGWGLDVLMARFFYWGSANYRDAVCVQGQIPECTQTLPYGAIQPRGWLPQETCWCENAYINATIRATMDLDHTAWEEYQFNAWANAGPDNIWNTTDDQPEWTFGSLLMDYVPRVGSGSPGAEGYPNSELRWYEGLRQIHASPGSYAYGQPYEYLVSPTRWILNAGSTLTLRLPSFEIPWYDPHRSTWDAAAKIGNYVTFLSTLALKSITPTGNYYTWDSRAKVVSIAGPYDWGAASLPVVSAPYIEFVPETTA